MMINEKDRYVCTILPLSNKKKETPDGDIYKSWVSLPWSASVLKEWDKGYQGSSIESDEDILGYWGKKKLTLQTLLWMPIPCKLFHAKQWWLRMISCSFPTFPFTIVCSEHPPHREQKDPKPLQIWIIPCYPIT